MDINKLLEYGIGVNNSTYFKFKYVLLAGDHEYDQQHVAIFGMN